MWGQPCGRKQPRASWRTVSSTITKTLGFGSDGGGRVHPQTTAATTARAMTPTANLRGPAGLEAGSGGSFASPFSTWLNIRSVRSLRLKSASIAVSSGYFGRLTQQDLIFPFQSNNFPTASLTCSFGLPAAAARFLKSSTVSRNLFLSPPSFCNSASL